MVNPIHLQRLGKTENSTFNEQHLLCSSPVLVGAGMEFMNKKISQKYELKTYGNTSIVNWGGEYMHPLRFGNTCI